MMDARRRFIQFRNAQIEQFHAMSAEIDMGTRIAAAAFDIDNHTFTEFLMEYGLADTPADILVAEALRNTIGA
jgi:hypothetical protein